MTLTWALLAKCRHLYLHFEGAQKNTVFEQATAAAESQNIQAMPVRTLLYQSQATLSIYRSE